MVLLYAVITLGVGIAGIFFGNFPNIADIIKEGKLDFYLTLPKDELLHLLVSNMRFHAFGDLFFGLAIAIIFIPIIKWPLLLILTTLSGIIILSFAIIVGSITFFIGSSGELTKSALFSLYTLASYPLEIFKGYIKFIMLTIIPAAFVTGVPVKLLKIFDFKSFLIMIIFTIIFATIAVIIFKFGIKKYESGNLINIRL